MNKKLKSSMAIIIILTALWPANLLAQAEVTCESDYIVQAGDFLTKIAADTLDNSKLYPAIIAATNAKAATDSSYHPIGQNNIVQEGWKLCIPSAADAPGLLGSVPASTANPNGLTVDALANATYSGIYEEPITLTNGAYEGEPFSADSPTRPTVTLINNGIIFGDLDGDGVEDAVVFLVESSGGSGNFVYVAAQLNQNGQPFDAGAVWIEDRIKIKSAAIENGQIKLEITAEGPGDAACCKSHKTHKTYALQNDQLAEVAGPEEPLKKISAADLNGTTWTLIDLNFDLQPALADTPVTISFKDRQISGSGGCNTYTGSFTLGVDNPFVMTISPVAATKKACPDPTLSQETAYFTALEHTSQWGYQVGDLTISYDNGQGGLNTLVFAPQSAPPGLTTEQLKNATYSGIYDDPVTLTDGAYEGEPFSADSTERPRVTFINNGIIYGDLDGDGVQDAVVFLEESADGTGHFIYVSTQLNQNGQPVDAGVVMIEDRIQVKSVAIENGQIKLEITAEGPGDAACCKSHKTRKTYALQNGQLAEIPGEEAALEKVSATDLNGTTWTLLELDEDQPALADTAVTLSFAGDQLNGSGGCNNYNGSFTLGADNPFVMTIGPVVSTQMACPDPILNQETAYLKALQTVNQWGYWIGKLVLYYDKGQGDYGRLLLAPPAAAASSQADSGLVKMLTGTTWQWVSLTDPVQQFAVDNPENYTLTFLPDGTLQIKADCNMASSSYTAAEDGSLTVQPGITTLAACPPESRSEEFVQKLGFAARYFFQDGNLFIDLKADGGTLKLSASTN